MRGLLHHTSSSSPLCDLHFLYDFSYCAVVVVDIPTTAATNIGTIFTTTITNTTATTCTTNNVSAVRSH